MNTKTRLFTLTWDNSKIPNLEYETRFHPRTAEGVHFATGIVALDNGVLYEDMGRLERHLNAYGKCRVDYHDEDPTQPEPGRETDKQAVVPRYRVPKRR